MMWRALLINPIVVVVSACIGILFCRAFAFDPHLHELVLAAGICLLSSELGLLPVVFNNFLLRAQPAQAALLGTVVHLMLAAMFSAVVLICLHPPMAFIYWLLAMYWITLGWMCVLFIKIIRQPALTPPLT